MLSHESADVWHVVVEQVAAAEMDEMWSFVQKKAQQRWLWHAIDHHTGKVLAYVFGRRKDEVFLHLRALLEPFGLTRFYTDYSAPFKFQLTVSRKPPVVVGC